MAIMRILDILVKRFDMFNQLQVIVILQKNKMRENVMFILLIYLRYP